MHTTDTLYTWPIIYLYNQYITDWVMKLIERIKPFHKILFIEYEWSPFK